MIHRSGMVLAFASAIVPAALLSSALVCAQSPSAPGETQYWQQNLLTWRAQHEAQISAPDGWLTLTGLDWLKSGVNTIGSAADNTIRLPQSAPAHLGMLIVMGGVNSGHASVTDASNEAIVQLLSPAGGFPAELTLDGKPAREGTLQVEETSSSTIAWHGISLAVLKRGDRFVLRIKDADSPVRAAFKGLNWYPPNPAYRVNARWIPFKPPVVQEVPTVIGTKLRLTAPGLAMFLINGKVMQLEPVLEDPSGTSLFFILRDATSKTTTYGGGRFLHTGLPDHGLKEPGNLVLDFNRLENPPCAYTDFATCPLPPSQNDLEIELSAGEKRYRK